MLAVESEILNEAIANYMTVNGAANTISGNYIFYVTDLAEHFHVQKEYIIAQENEILMAFNREIVSEGSFYKESDGCYVFDLMFFGNYCNVDMED